MLSLSKTDSLAIHCFRNILIISFSLFLLPLSASVTLVAIVFRHIRAIHSPKRYAKHDNEAPRILVTGLGMTKGLFIARTMYLGGCEVFGADFSEPGNLSCGRFSVALRKFFSLKNPNAEGIATYISQVLEIIISERIQLWVSCSGVATATADARLARAIEKSTTCKTFQFNEQVVSTLDDKLKFMQKTTELGLACLQWFPLRSSKDMGRAVKFIEDSQESGLGVSFVVKSANMDDATRGSLPLLNSRNLQEAKHVLTSLDYTEGRQWILQEFVDSGEEYCTHAVIVNGQVRAFTACPSASVLMHYCQLDSNSLLYGQMLKFTHDYATGLGNITGHLSFDFLVRYHDAEGGILATLVPIECNPRCHTAIVLFEGCEVQLSDVYLEVMKGVQSKGILEPACKPEMGFFWMSHDLVVLGLSALVNIIFTREQSNRAIAIQQVLDCILHISVWRDPTFLWWDPLPSFVLNHLYWPCKLVLASWHGTKWKQLNVSTTKMFKA
jgi:hypothetical protein